MNGIRNFQRHRRSHEPNYKRPGQKNRPVMPNICVLCNKVFKSGWFMNRHLKAVHKDGKLKGVNICAFCKKNFRQRWKLNSHIESVHRGKMEIKLDFDS